MSTDAPARRPTNPSRRVTARLEECNKRFGSVLTVSAITLERAAVSPPDLRGPELIDLRGRGAPVAVHYLPMASSAECARAAAQ